MKIGDTVLVKYSHEIHKGFVIASIPYTKMEHNPLIYICTIPNGKILTNETISEWENWFKPCRLLLTEKVHIYSHE